MTVHDNIEKSTCAFVEEHPGLKYIFFGGKGGVGKTVMAGAAALWYARQGRRTLLASTNPVHSLTGMLGQDVFGKPTLVEGETNFWAYEIDTKDTIEESKKEIREKIEWFLKYADIKTKAEEFVESATMNPAFEESAMFENMIDLMFEDDYDVYVFDTAPTANARRLLGMSDVYSMWVNKMVQSREEAQSLKELLSYSKETERDPLMEYLLTFRDRMQHAKELLTDDGKTAFFFITLPEALPIAVIQRFLKWFEEFGIPVGGWWSICGLTRLTWGTIPRSSSAIASRCRGSTWRRSGSALTTCGPSSPSSRPRFRVWTRWRKYPGTCLVNRSRDRGY